MHSQRLVRAHPSRDGENGVPVQRGVCHEGPIGTRSWRPVIQGETN
jgi:hypothetical protein